MYGFFEGGWVWNFHTRKDEGGYVWKVVSAFSTIATLDFPIKECLVQVKELGRGQ